MVDVPGTIINYTYICILIFTQNDNKCMLPFWRDLMQLFLGIEKSIRKINTQPRKKTWFLMTVKTIHYVSVIMKIQCHYENENTRV